MNPITKLRYELIYLLGGVPHEHINTINYKNIGSVMAQLRRYVQPNDQTK